jgi:CBS domain-containing protein
MNFTHKWWRHHPPQGFSQRRCDVLFSPLREEFRVRMPRGQQTHMSYRSDHLAVGLHFEIHAMDLVVTMLHTWRCVMKVSDVMSEPVLTCRPDTTLSAAARLMREADYGTLPVVDAEGQLVGIITDRDICLEIALSNRNANRIAVHEAMTKKVLITLAGDDLHSALGTMKRARVRRLPVLNADGRLNGMLSIEDVVVKGLETGGVSTDEIVLALRTMYERRPAEIVSTTDF